SSRRRHTRSKRDWSSDVCSSDLGILARDSERNGGIVNHHPNFPVGKTVPESRSVISDRHCSRGVQVRKQLHGFDVFGTVYRKLRSEERRVGKEQRWREAAERAEG